MKFSVAIAEEALPAEPVLFRGDLIESMGKAEGMGYDAAEIHTRDAALLDLDALTGRGEKTSFTVSALATGLAKRVDGLTFISDDEAVREEAVARVKKFIEAAERLKTGVIVGSLRGIIPNPAERDVYDRRFRDCLEQLLPEAQNRGVDIHLEMINRYENNYLNTAREGLEYIKPLASGNLKLHLDTYHMNIEEADMTEAIRACGDRLGYFHVAENTRRYVGSGAIDFAKVFSALKDIGYRGYVSLECLALPDPDTAARKSIDFMRSIDRP
ncbi:MAG: sugar phosphate isomerase/epimerase [Planctomycetota bacterium]|jgi:sugar phosphate isomerase/epimerase|nr:sugar phosphate isomerase/epimerase [Planctomycetota bacterium]